jgi:hypothetical protein
MRKLLSALGATAITVALVGAGFQASSSATTVGRKLTFSTKLISFNLVDVGPRGLSAGDQYVISSHIVRNGERDGLTSASCIFTVTTGPVLRNCSINFALSRGLITTSGYATGDGSVVRLVVTGGTGIYTGVSGFGELRPTKPGSDVSLHLLG